jgi:hypothetical protein
MKGIFDRMWCQEVNYIPIWYLENGVMGALGGAVAGAIIDFAMLWLLNHPKQSVQLGTSATQVN